MIHYQDGTATRAILFNWSKYDNRHRPNFNYDFSQNVSLGDKTIDYIVVYYRWAPRPTIYPTVTAVAGVLPNLNTYNLSGGYRIQNDCGFTQFRGDGTMFGMFIHETAHTAYDCPHYATANNVTGICFYGQVAGWGAMKLADAQGNTPFMTDNAWERWYIGWMPDTATIRANNQRSDIQYSELTPQGHYFTLRDFATTGDALRIEIPVSENRVFGGGKSQRLWLENRQGKSSLYDRRRWVDVEITNTDGSKFYDTVKPAAKGIYAYVEDITSSRNEVNVFQKGANAIKYLHKQGNYDYTVNGIHSETYWGNTIYNFREGAANPYSGQSRPSTYRCRFCRLHHHKLACESHDANNYLHFW